MKKAFSILICTILGVGASVADVLTTMDFENSNLWGKIPNYGLDDSGLQGSGIGSYWYYAGDEAENASKIRAYKTNEARYDRFDSLATNACPSYMHTARNNNGLLSVTTPGVLHRAFISVPAPTGPTQSKCLAVPDSGLFIDNLVYFSMANKFEDPAEIAAGNAKLACRLVNNAQTRFAPRLIVTASCLRDGAVVYTNYLTNAKVEEGVWYRLTAKVVANASTQSGKSYPAFVLYLDGQRITCNESDYVIGDEAKTVFAGNEDFDARGLFMSLQPVNNKRYAQRVYSLGFKGVGSVDEIGVTDVNPLAVMSGKVDVAIVCEDEKIEKLTAIVTDDDGTAKTNELTGAISGTLLAATPGCKIEFIPEAPKGYGFAKEVMVNGNVATNVVKDVSGYTITFASPRDGVFADSSRVTATIVSKNVYFDVGKWSYSTFQEAAAAATTNDDKTIRLQASVVLSPGALEDNGQAKVLPGQDVIFDLQGHTLIGTNLYDEAAVYNQGNLTIIDSVGGGVIQAPGTAIEVVRDNDAIENNYNRAEASLTIGSESTKLFTVKGRVRNTRGKLEVMGGQYLNPSDESTDEFYLKDYITDPRFVATPTKIDDLPGFCVTNSGDMRIVRFLTAHGTATPEFTLVPAGDTVEPAVVKAPGYTFVNWLQDGYIYDFTAPVEKSATLQANLSLDTYSIQNDSKMVMPTTYTVESAYTPLRSFTKSLCEFAGWKDKATGNFVDAVGQGAMFVGTDNVVTGNLDLVATWKPVQIRWENTEHSFAESNGTYAGTWPMTFPVDVTYTEGMKLKIKEIDLCIVNPATYPKTSVCLAVTPAGGTPVISAPRTYELDPTTSAYLVGTNELANGRAKVAYKFDNLVVQVGVQNEVRFVTESGDKTEGFLRLIRGARQARYMIIGNCATDEESAPSTRYGEYCPAYEIYGEAVLTDE